MKKWLKQVAVLGMSMVILLSGCGQGHSKNNESEPKKAMGRYVEEELCLENKIDEQGTILFWKTQEGKLEALIKNKTFQNYELTEGGDWKEANPAFLPKLNEQYPNIQEISFVEAGKTPGTYYIAGMEDNSKSFIAECANGQFKPTYQVEDLSEIANRMLLWRGDLSGDGEGKFVGVADQQIVVFNIQGKVLGKIPAFLCLTQMVGDKIYVIGEDKVEIYNNKDYQLEKTIDSVKCKGYGIGVCADENNALYLANEEGVTRIADDGNIIEKIIEGDLCNLSSYSVGQSIYYNDELYVVYRDYKEKKTKLSRFYYDPNKQTVPDEKLVVWSYTNFHYIKDVIKVYKEKHPDMYIKPEHLYDYANVCGGVIQPADIETFNTQMLAGEGPDIIVLDGLNYESYASKGMLEDLTDDLKEWEKETPLLDNIVSSYIKDNEIYGIPLRFSMIMGVGDKQYLQNGFHFIDIANSQEPFPKGKVLFGTTGFERSSVMLDLMQDQVMTKDHKVNREILIDFMKAVKRSSHSYQKELTYWFENWRSYFSTSSGLEKEAVQADLSKVEQLEELQVIARMISENPKYMITDQVENNSNLVQGQQVIAINKNSKNKEAAKEFIKLALSDEMQSIDERGLSINLNTFKKQLIPDDRKNLMVMEPQMEYYDYKNVMGTSKEEKYANEEMMQQFIDKAQKATVLMPIDENVRRIISTVTEEYCKESISLEQAVNSAEEKVNMYMSERGE